MQLCPSCVEARASTMPHTRCRFANKNVIALGLGCSASGPLVLALQIGLRMGPTPTRHQQVRCGVRAFRADTDACGNT